MVAGSPDLHSRDDEVLMVQEKHWCDVGVDTRSTSKERDGSSFLDCAKKKDDKIKIDYHFKFYSK